MGHRLRWTIGGALCCALLVLWSGAASAQMSSAAVGLDVFRETGVNISLKQILGMFLYFDDDLSNPKGQSCASCHLPRAGFVDPDDDLPVSAGAKKGRYGSRNAMTTLYAKYSPLFAKRPGTPGFGAGAYFGGQFWDGRAMTLADQASRPFINPVEMNMTKAEVVDRVKKSFYAPLFLLVYGLRGFSDVDTAYANIAAAIGDFETTPFFTPFDSKFDRWVENPARYPLTASAQRGLIMFNTNLASTTVETGGLTPARCAFCHAIPATPLDAQGKPQPSSRNPEEYLFTDFNYHNIGVPVNPEVRLLLKNPGFIDLGLGGRLRDDRAKGLNQLTDAEIAIEDGRFKTSTLRDIRESGPYGHNGRFETLAQIVHFYNTRAALPVCATDTDPGFGKTCWPASEVVANRAAPFISGNLQLTAAQEKDVVAFLETLSDDSVSRLEKLGQVVTRWKKKFR